MIDPPSGWKYGFPKPYIDEKGNEPTDSREWLIKNGYPKHEIESYGEWFSCRFWEEEISDNNLINKDDKEGWGGC